MPEIGKIKEVDIRELWTYEAANFTPWLAYQGGLDCLGKVLDLKFASAKHEVTAGKFKADVVCMEVSNPRGHVKVVIENQLKKFDHDHLGKALTYAETLQAGICIWIAREFTREHRAFVETQNAKPDREVDWYCVRISAYRVDNSNPVPKFEVVVRPDSGIPSNLRTVPKSQTVNVDSDTVTNAFMDRLKFELRPRDASVLWGKPPKDEPSYLRINFRHKIAQISVVRKTGRIRVRLYLKGRGHRELYFRLERYRDSIENDVGAALQWSTNAKRSSIDLGRDANLADRSKWDKEIAWCQCKVDLFLDVFVWRLEALKLGESIDPLNRPATQ